MYRLFTVSVLLITLSGCAPAQPEVEMMTSTSPATATPAPEPPTLGAGFRFSTYGIGSNPGPEYWIAVGQKMSSRFSSSRPETIWIVGNFFGSGKTYLNFHAETDDPNITSGFVDMNEQMLDLFDEHGFRVWLQVEPADADMLTLIDLVLNQYKHHPSVIGFGVDVEWYKSNGSALGTPVTDEEAETWVKAIRAHNPDYWLFLKHWETEFMPPTHRNGIVFINDSQQFESLDHLIEDFATWGKHFAPAPVGFQYGYPADRHWWINLQDPPREIGHALLQEIPNTVSLFWVDFTIKEIFPP